MQINDLLEVNGQGVVSSYGKQKLTIPYKSLVARSKTKSREQMGKPDKVKSSHFSPTDFIQADAEHIRGTECDQKILSKRESHGQVFSPNYPFPYQTNVVCR